MNLDAVPRLDQNQARAAIVEALALLLLEDDLDDETARAEARAKFATDEEPSR